MKPTFYQIVENLVKTNPNNMDLGDKVRKIIWKIEESKNVDQADPNQITIFDEIKERQDEY